MFTQKFKSTMNHSLRIISLLTTSIALIQNYNQSSLFTKAHEKVRLKMIHCVKQTKIVKTISINILGYVFKQITAVRAVKDIL